MVPDIKNFAAKWIAAWNSHDLERILSHYAEEVEVTTPMIRVALEIDSGTLKGKDAVRTYWKAALLKVPNLRFELIEYATSINSIALCYKSVMEKIAIEVMFFDTDGMISKVIAHYK